MIAELSPNTAPCTECGGEGSDKDRPESGWMTCDCGHFWIEAHDRIPVHTLNQAE